MQLLNLFERTDIAARGIDVSGVRGLQPVADRVVLVDLDSDVEMMDELLDGVRVGAGVQLENVIVDAGAEIAGGSKRGTAEAVTLIGADGRVAVTERFDRSATLPSGF